MALRILASAVTGTALLFGAWSAATASDADGKAIRVRGSDGDLSVTLTAGKGRYEVDEAIGLKVRGNKRFYLYLFSVNESSGKAVMLIPNDRQAGNRYEPDRTYEVPGRSIEFYSDRPGTEKIIMVASTRWIDFPDDKYEAAGNFKTAQASVVEDQVKALRIRRREGAEKVIKELTLRITGAGERSVGRDSGERGQGPIPFVSTDRTGYAMGDRVRAIFGADHEGWVHLYSVDPDGRADLLKRQRVNGRDHYQVAARAVGPRGQHALIAVYSEQRRVDSRNVENLGEAANAKGLQLIDDAEMPAAVYRFHISR